MNFSYHDLLRAKNYAGQPVRYVQRKYDGLRLLVRVLDRSLGTTFIDAMTRDGKTDHAFALSQSHIGETLQQVPVGTALDCELWAEGRHATSVITAIKDLSPDLRLTVFAVPWWAGKDTRSHDLIDILSTARKHGLQTATVEPMHKRLLSAPAPVQVELLKKDALAMGWEGFVVKEAHYHGWYKVKPTATCDLVVLGYTISDSLTHFGHLKALQVGLPDGTELASVGSGFDQEWRHSIDPKTLIGRVCEIQYDALAAKGKLKFPRFVRWREDKTAAECTKEQFS